MQIEDWKHLSFPTAEDDQQKTKGKERDQDLQTEIADDDQDLTMADTTMDEQTTDQMNGSTVENENTMDDADG